MTDIIGHLIKLGLSEYEAKAYIATVALGEGTIKEISDESKVPRSRAYDVMERLLQKGFVEVGNSRPRCYRDNDPSEALGQLLEEIRRSKDEVVRALNEIGKKAEKRDNPIWTIKGEWAIDHKVIEMLDSAKKEVIVINLSTAHLIRYAKQITKASEEKSVTVVLIHRSDDFTGLLGKAKLIKFDERILDAPQPWMKGEKDFMAKNADFDVEMLLVCDHNISMILSKEGNGHRAIISSGTVLDFFVNRFVDIALRDMEQITKNGKKAAKR
ncbi:MAG: helix-turn-helix domain-containing protein [Methanomassiliicoccales archaeon]|jgi:sugar-specific transcriptional regulator TrmB